MACSGLFVLGWFRCEHLSRLGRVSFLKQQVMCAVEPGMKFLVSCTNLTHAGLTDCEKVDISISLIS